MLTKPIRHSSLALALLAVATACHSQSAPPVETATPPPAVPALPSVTAAEKALATQQYAQIRQMASLGERCAWLGPAELAAVAASVQERRAWLEWQDLDIPAAETQADTLVTQSRGIDCNSAEGEEHRLGVGYGAWQMRSSWALRAHAMLPAADRPAWFAGKSSVVEQQAALDEAVSGLKAINAASVERSQAMFAKDAERMLATRCTDADPACPATANAAAATGLAGSDNGWVTYAETVLKHAETYAAMLASTDDKTGSPPEPKTR